MDFIIPSTTLGHLRTVSEARPEAETHTHTHTKLTNDQHSKCNHRRKRAKNGTSNTLPAFTYFPA